MAKKSFISKFKSGIRFVVSIFASREFGFIYCLIGTVSQIAHTYFLVTNISSLNGNWKNIQAMGISIFISSSLLFFTAIASNDDSKDSKRIHLAVNLFMIIEILINFYYYTRHLIIDSQEIQIFDFIFGVLVSCLIPVTIKLYAGLIQAREWLEEFKDENQNNDSVSEKDIENFVNKIVESKFSIIAENPDNQISEERIKEISKQYFDEIRDDIDSKVSDLFQKNSEIFLRQFEHKLKYIIDKKYKNYDDKTM